ncbi:MAG: Fur family transcriptional regulator [Pseudomonadota bacterium]
MYKCSDHQSCMDNALQKADLICRQRNLRFTNLRRKVLQMIWADHHPSKAYELLDKLKKDISAKPPTIYRALNFLMENGLIHKLNSLNAYIGCAHPLKHHECYFLICNICKNIEECYDHKLSKAIVNATYKNKFYLDSTVLEINGKCQKCIKK